MVHVVGANLTLIPGQGNVGAVVAERARNQYFVTFKVEGHTNLKLGVIKEGDEEVVEPRRDVVDVRVVRVIDNVGGNPNPPV